MTSEEILGEPYDTECPYLSRVVVRVKRPEAYSNHIPKPVSVLGARGDDQCSGPPVPRSYDKGLAHPSPGRSLPARSCRVDNSRGYPWGRPDLSRDCWELRSTCTGAVPPVPSVP